jgi:Ca-activated chloride channel family protein
VIGFERPWAFALLILPAGLFLLRRRAERRGDRAVELPSLPETPKTVASLFSFLPPLLSLLGLSTAIVALCGPRRFERRALPSARGTEIAVVLDVSGSMAAEDFQPVNRLEVARRVVADFIRGRPDDSIALLAFAGEARTICPATTDQETLLSLLAQTDGSKFPDGTAIGNAIATAVARLKDLPGRSRVAVLVTDGGNNAGQIDPETAANLARGFGIRVHTVAVGRGGRVPITLTFKDPSTGETVRRRVEANVDVDEGLLRSIAAQTGGRFFRAADSDALRSILGEIDGLEKQVVPSRFEIVPKDLSRAPLAAAAIFLFLALALSAGPLRVESEAA